MSFSYRTGLVYIPAQDPLFPFLSDRNFKFRPGAWNIGIDMSILTEPPPEWPRGHLLAWDPVAQKEKWRAQYDIAWNGGTLSTAGNLVFQGTGDGRFVAYSADKGEKLWEAAVGTGVVAAPVTYRVGGVQYVSVMAGWGGVYALVIGGGAGNPVPGRLLTFSLNGQESLPEIASEMREVSPIEFDAPAERISAGAALYARWCSMCHGPGAVSGGLIADLRYSKRETYDSYREIVLGGQMSGAGMPVFKQWLSEEEVEAIRSYVLKRRSEIKPAASR
jgi:quinohemoprotein ethanol dehydrogenase